MMLRSYSEVFKLCYTYHFLHPPSPPLTHPHIKVHSEYPTLQCTPPLGGLLLMKAASVLPKHLTLLSHLATALANAIVTQARFSVVKEEVSGGAAPLLAQTLRTQAHTNCTHRNNWPKHCKKVREVRKSPVTICLSQTFDSYCNCHLLQWTTESSEYCGWIFPWNKSVVQK